MAGGINRILATAAPGRCAAPHGAWMVVRKRFCQHRPADRQDG
jgi:hypothetical protein